MNKILLIVILVLILLWLDGIDQKVWEVLDWDWDYYYRVVCILEYLINSFGQKDNCYLFYLLNKLILLKSNCNVVKDYVINFMVL